MSAPPITDSLGDAEALLASLRADLAAERAAHAETRRLLQFVVAVANEQPRFVEGIRPELLGKE